jgi:hypothetical protein
MTSGTETASTPTKKPPPLAPLKTAKNLGETVANFDAIVAWAIDAPSGIGYFATIYKRATVAVSNAIDTGKFHHPDVMTRFTLTFSQRYFDALNAHFHPNDHPGPTHVWQWAFDGVAYTEPIIFQHLLTAVDAHINLDLGITAAQVGGGAMDDLHHDFDMINAILGSQVQGVFDALAKVSPRTHTIRNLLPGDEVEEINALLIVFRDLAWKFANVLADSPNDFQELVDLQDSRACLLSTCYLYPPEKIRAIVDWIADKESRDVALNVRTLDVAAAIPNELNEAFLPR